MHNPVWTNPTIPGSTSLFDATMSRAIASRIARTPTVRQVRLWLATFNNCLIDSQYNQNVARSCVSSEKFALRGGTNNAKKTQCKLTKAEVQPVEACTTSEPPGTLMCDRRHAVHGRDRGRKPTSAPSVNRILQRVTSTNSRFFSSVSVVLLSSDVAFFIRSGCFVFHLMLTYPTVALCFECASPVLEYGEGHQGCSICVAHHGQSPRTQDLRNVEWD